MAIAMSRMGIARPGTRAPAATAVVSATKVAVVLSTVLLLAGCGAPGPTVGGTAGTAWLPAAIEQPAGLVAGESVPPGQFCSPCHGSATLMLGVADSPFGVYAVGYVQPGPSAAIWRSTDGGRTWARVTGIEATEGTAIYAVAADGTRVVAVGADGSGAAAWATIDGVHWTRAAAAASLAGIAGGTAMTAVVAWRGGFVAAGRAQDAPAGSSVAAAWLSADGLTWRRVPDGGFAAGAITGLAAGAAAGAGRIVAVGIAPPTTVRGIQHETSVAWVSEDGLTWRRVTAPSLSAGAMRAVAAGGPGFVAVGSGAADDRAMAWTSPDGIDWTAAPVGAAFLNYTLPIRAHAVVATGSGLVAVGWKSDGGNGSAVAWRSPDGVRWMRLPDLPSFSGGEMDGVAIVGTELVAVGLTGYPDNDAAFAWTGAP